MTPRGYQAWAIAKAIRFYLKTGIPVNTAYTPRNMLATANQITGRTFKRGQLLQAASALEEIMETL